MGQPSRDLPLWVPVVLGVALAGGAAWRLGDSAMLPGSIRGALPGLDSASRPAPLTAVAGSQPGVLQGAPPEAQRTAAPVAGYTPEPRRVRIDLLSRSTMLRFAFDPARAGRVVSCESESPDGGGSWRRLGDSPLTRSIALGGSRAAVPVLRAGRVLCGDAILPAGRGAPSGTRVGDVQSAVEWNGRDWQPVGLPVAQAAGSAADGRVTVAVGYTRDGSPMAVRGDRLLTPSGERVLPGPAEAWAADRDGALYAAIAPQGRRARMMWAADPDAAWQALPVPGDVRGIAADGHQVWIAAGMLGRGRRDRWDWTRWPDGVRVDGVTGWGTTVVAWGDRPDGVGHGALVVSRDGGATLEVRRLGRLRPIWAAVDPHHPDEVLVLADDGTIARARID